MALNFALPNKSIEQETPPDPVAQVASVSGIQNNEQTRRGKGLVEIASEYKAGLLVREPFNPGPVLALFDDFNSKIDEMFAEVGALTVTDEKSSLQASEMASQAARLSNKIDKAHKKAKEPYLQVTRPLDGLVRGLLSKCDDLKSRATKANSHYLIEQEKKRQAEAAKAAEEARKQREAAEQKAAEATEEKAEALGVDPAEVPVEPVTVPTSTYIPPEKTAVQTDSGSQSVEYDMQWEIVDFKMLPEECIEARHKQLVGAVAPWLNAKKKAEVYNIPGVVFKKVPVIKTRAKR